MDILASNWGRRLVAFAAAAAATLVATSLAHSLMVQAELSKLGVELPLGIRLSGIVRDLAGLAPTLGVVLALSLLVAFPVAAFIGSRAGGFWRALAYPLAGLAAVALALLVMRLVFGFSALAGARTLPGFLLMSLGGLMGGLAFLALSPRALGRGDGSPRPEV